jgi:hypothetical protein
VTIDGDQAKTVEWEYTDDVEVKVLERVIMEAKARVKVENDILEYL